MGKKKVVIQSTQSISPILDIKDGVIVSKDEHFYWLLEFEPINYELLSLDDKAAIIDGFAAAIRTWPNLVHVKVVSVRSDAAPYIRTLEKSRDRELAEGNRGCAALIEDQIRLVNEVSTTQGVSRRFFIIIKYESDGGFRKRPPFSEIRSSLEREARNIAMSLETLGVMQVSSSDREYILEAMYQIVCRSQSEIVPFEERKEAILERYRENNQGREVPIDEIPVNDFISPDRINIAISPNYLLTDTGSYTSYCFIPSDAYPVRAYGGWLQILFSFIDSVDVDFWIERQDAAKLKPKLTYSLKANRLRQNEKEDIAADFETLTSTIDAGYYLKGALAQGDDVYYMASMLSINAQSIEELDARYLEMRDYCIRNDMQLQRCTFQQEAAYVAGYPLADYDRGLFEKSKRNITGTMLGSAFPFTANELRDRNGVFFGVDARWDSPAYVDIWDRNKLQSGNMLVIGPSGAGKTYAMLAMALRQREYYGVQTIILSPTKSFELLRACESVGGEYIKIAPGSSQNINIMEIRDYEQGDSAKVNGSYESGSILIEKIQQVHDFVSLILPNMNEMEVRALDNALKKTYSEYGITEDNSSLIDASTGRYKEMPTLADLYRVLGEQGGYAERVHGVLATYVTGTARSFSEPTNVRLDSKFIVVDVGSLTDAMLPLGMFICLDWIFDMCRQDRTRRKLICCEESWKMMDNPHSAKFLRRCFREIRGYDGAIWAATQTASEFILDSTGVGGEIWDNARLKLLLPMDKKEVDTLSSVIDLTAEEVSQLKRTTLVAKNEGRRNALFVANNNHIFIQILASAMEHDLITTNADDLKRIANAKI